MADSPTGHTLQTMNIALRTWGCHIVGQAGYKMGPLLPQDELERRYQGETARVAEAMFQAIAQRANPAKVALARLAGAVVFRFVT